MSYTSGKMPDLESRMHSLAQATGDLDNDLLESTSYTLPNYLKEKLNREFRKKKAGFNIVDTGSYF